jgi:fatty-acyl-CoA synthase
MAESLERADAAGAPYDLSSLTVIASSGMVFSPRYKRALLARHKMALIDNLASTEARSIASSVATSVEEVTDRFRVSAHAVVLDEGGIPVTWGSGEVGMLAVGGPGPLGYYKDSAKTAATFREIGGKRYTLTGDWARIEADGSITLLGRGAKCINTAGEKVYPDEVEQALRLCDGVEDCLVIGLPDARWGEKVAAIVACSADRVIDPAELLATARRTLAGYKCPKSVFVCGEIKRGAAGKADYAWAAEFVRDAADLIAADA